MQIPLLKDHHAHPFMAAVLRDCINLKAVSTKTEALSLIKMGEEEINLILGWHNGRYTFEEGELEQLPPVVICNKSFHSFLINPAAREKLRLSYPEMAKHIEDKLWVDKNLSKILKFMASIHAYTPYKIKQFFSDRSKKQSYYRFALKKTPSSKAVLLTTMIKSPPNLPMSVRVIFNKPECASCHRPQCVKGPTFPPVSS